MAARLQGKSALSFERHFDAALRAHCETSLRVLHGRIPYESEVVAQKGTETAQKLAFAKRGGFDLVAMVARDDNETEVDSGPLVPAPVMYQAALGTETTTT